MRDTSKDLCREELPFNKSQLAAAFNIDIFGSCHLLFLSDCRHCLLNELIFFFSEDRFMFSNVFNRNKLNGTDLE